ncbi:MAG: hypothetical protein EOO10_07050 [Chitinophagaceae bacterium]|nr:MAG: hypothetical protein EOO10_07050 [Chitinophagaceae bacterium]
MADKENKGGMLTNSQVEEDNKVKGKQEGAYEGAQDTGDKIVRQRGNEVQQRDGMPQEEKNEEE